jgi:hypothetical protein
VPVVVVLAAVVLAVALLGGCSGSRLQTDSSPDGTRLTIRAWPKGEGKQPVRRWTLVCPAGGTLPEPERACRALEGPRRLRPSPSPFAPLPRPRACTQVYGGPAEATVTGRFHGQRVHADFSRGDGCQIQRWDGVAFLFPGVSSG